jgi:hypothetical protein
MDRPDAVPFPVQHPQPSMRRDVVRNDEIPGSVCTKSAGALLGQEKIWRR